MFSRTSPLGLLGLTGMHGVGALVVFARFFLSVGSGRQPLALDTWYILLLEISPKKLALHAATDQTDTVRVRKSGGCVERYFGN